MREYANNSFEGKLNKDSEYKKVQNNELIHSENTTVVSENKYGQRRPIKGTELIGNLWFDEKNVLGAFDVLADYDYDDNGTFVSHESILIFSGTTDIHLFDTVTEQIHHIYPGENESLDFPLGGSIDGSFDKELGVSSFYFEDNKNMLRRLILRYPNTQTLHDFNVIPFFVNAKIQSVSVDTGGFLKGGSYQVAFRFYNTEKCNYSKWSVPSNPIPVSSGDCADLLNPDVQEGTPVGSNTDKKITVNLQYTDAAYQNYDSIQVAIISNTEGQPINALVANITAPKKDWYDNALIELRGNESVYTARIEDIVIDDIPVKSAKSNVISENRLFRANINLHDLSYDNGEVEIGGAKTISQTLPRIPYKCEELTHDKRGYFRKEVIPFYITYVDKYGNWSNPKPFDFSDLYKMKETGVEYQFNAKIYTGFADDKTQIFLTTTGPNLEHGDYVKIGTTVKQIFNVNLGIPSSFYVEGAISEPTGTTISKLYGQSGNQANNWAWKFPDRCDNQFTILNSSSNPTAIGLEIKDIKNHPSWAVGFAILRQKRIKNIVYQSPHIPMIGVCGVPTQGVGELKLNNEAGADYRGQYDTLAPKVFSLGNAKNIYRYRHTFEAIGSSGTAPFPNDDPYITYYSQYKGQSRDANDSRQIPTYCGVVPPDYIYNYNNPWYLHDFTGTEKMVITDAVLLRRRNLINEEIEKEEREFAGRYFSKANDYPERPRYSDYITYDSRYKGYNSFLADSANQYFYSRTGNHKVGSIHKYFKKLGEIDSHLNDTIDVEKADYLELGHPFVPIVQSAFTEERLSKCLSYGNVEQLARSQSTPQIVGSVSYFNQVYRNNKIILMNISKRLEDFSAVYGKNFANGINLFPSLVLPSPQISRIWDDSNLYDPNAKSHPNEIISSGTNYGLALRFGHIVDTSGLGPVVKNLTEPPQEESSLITPNYVCPDGQIAGGVYIVNIERGLSDDRYNKVSNELYFTGTFVPLTQEDVQNNVPKTVQVWGGDCFLTYYTVKVNDNSPRVSDLFETTSRYTNSPGIGGGGTALERNTKTGLYEKNVEFIQLYIESEVNTAYHEKTTEFPAYIGDDESNYTNPYFYKHNPGYSLQNLSKVWAAYLDTCNRNKTHIPATFIWSDKKIYGALSNEFVNTDGFNRYRVSARHDLDEQHGEITKIITFGMGDVHAIQERRIRYEPVERSIIQGADGQSLSITGDLIIGKGGYYLPIQNGSQHIRTIRVFDGACFMVDNLRQEVVVFGSQGSGFKTISSMGMQSEFLNMLKTKFSESELTAHLISLPNHSEYVVITPEKSLVWNNNIQGWACELITPDLIKSMVSSNKSAYWITNKLYKAYSGPQGWMMNQYIPSKITFVCNDADSVIKVFDTLRLNAEGFNKVDDIVITIPPQSNVPTQISHNLTKDRNGERLTFKNFQHTINSIRNQDESKKMFGRFCIVEITINNDGREVAIDSVETHFTQSPRNR